MSSVGTTCCSVAPEDHRQTPRTGRGSFSANRAAVRPTRVGRRGLHSHLEVGRWL